MSKKLIFKIPCKGKLLPLIKQVWSSSDGLMDRRISIEDHGIGIVGYSEVFNEVTAICCKVQELIQWYHDVERCDCWPHHDSRSFELIDCRAQFDSFTSDGMYTLGTMIMFVGNWYVKYGICLPREFKLHRRYAKEVRLANVMTSANDEEEDFEVSLASVQVIVTENIVVENVNCMEFEFASETYVCSEQVFSVSCESGSEVLLSVDQTWNAPPDFEEDPSVECDCPYRAEGVYLVSTNCDPCVPCRRYFEIANAEAYRLLSIPFCRDCGVELEVGQTCSRAQLRCQTKMRCYDCVEYYLELNAKPKQLKVSVVNQDTPLEKAFVSDYYKHFNFCCVDFEVYDRDTSKLLEVGYTRFKPCCNKLEVVHILIEENLGLSNSFVVDNKSKFSFGVSRVMTLDEFVAYFCFLVTESDMFIVCCDVHLERRVFDRLGIVGCRFVDVQILFGLDVNNNRTSLTNLCDIFSIPVVDLHNAANDSVAVFGLFVKLVGDITDFVHFEGFDFTPYGIYNYNRNGFWCPGCLDELYSPSTFGFDVFVDREMFVMICLDWARVNQSLCGPCRVKLK